MVSCKVTVLILYKTNSRLVTQLKLIYSFV
jgi:hypothetical protein